MQRSTPRRCVNDSFCVESFRSTCCLFGICLLLFVRLFVVNSLAQTRYFICLFFADILRFFFHHSRVTWSWPHKFPTSTIRSSRRQKALISAGEKQKIKSAPCYFLFVLLVLCSIFIKFPSLHSNVIADTIEKSKKPAAPRAKPRKEVCYICAYTW